MYGQDQGPKKYGLTIPKKKPLPGMRGRPPPASAAARRYPPGSAFSLDNDDSDEEGGDDDLASKASYNKMLQVRNSECGTWATICLGWGAMERCVCILRRERRVYGACACMLLGWWVVERCVSALSFSPISPPPLLLAAFPIWSQSRRALCLFSTTRPLPPHFHKQARSAKAQKQLEEAEAAARAADPSIYDYDGVYDTMQAERQERAKAVTEAAKEEKKSSKYINGLKRAAELKKQEQDRFYERRLAKERKEEDELYKDKEVFGKYLTCQGRGWAGEGKEVSFGGATISISFLSSLCFRVSRACVMYVCGRWTIFTSPLSPFLLPSFHP